MFGWHCSCMCDMTHVCVTMTHVCVAWLMYVWHDSCMCDRTHVCVTWLMYTWRDSCICGITHVCVFDMKSWLVHVWHDSCLCMWYDIMTSSGVTWLIRTPWLDHRNHAHAQGSPPWFAYVTWHVTPWLMYIYVPWLMHIYVPWPVHTRRGLLLHFHTGRDMLHHDSYTYVSLCMHTRRVYPDSNTWRAMLQHDTFIYVAWIMHTRRGRLLNSHTQDVICCTMTYSYMYVSLHMHNTQGSSP